MNEYDALQIIETQKARIRRQELEITATHELYQGELEQKDDELKQKDALVEELTEALNEATGECLPGTHILPKRSNECYRCGQRVINREFEGVELPEWFS